MSVPKKRQAKGRSKRRNAHNSLSIPPYKVTDDGTVVPRHHATPEELEKKQDKSNA